MVKVSKKELQTRREFFKQAAKGVLPILGLTVLGPVLNACSKDDDGGCQHCRGNCSKTCGNVCKGTVARSSSCKANCTSFCISTCRGECYTSAKDNG